MKLHHQIKASLICCMFLFLFSCSDKNNNQSGNHPDTFATATDTASAPATKKKSEATAWAINESESKITFTITNFGKEVNGSFGNPKGTIRFDEKNLAASKFDANVPVSTINTGNNMRDKDLMHDKYFDAEHYPDITFQSDSIFAAGKEFKAKGTFTIKGKSRQQVLPFTFTENGNSGVFKSDFVLNRKDFDIGGNGNVMGDDIHISLQVAVNKQ